MHHGIEAIDRVRPLGSIAERSQQGGNAEPYGERVGRARVALNRARKPRPRGQDDAVT